MKKQYNTFEKSHKIVISNRVNWIIAGFYIPFALLLC